MDFAHFTTRDSGSATNEIVVFDMDGVLADARHRTHLITGETTNWEAFFAACVDDAPVDEYVRRLAELSVDHHALILTSRPVAVRPQTIEWMRRHNIRWDTLVMRRSRAEISSAAYKKAVVVHLLEKGKRVVLAFDDDSRNIDEFVALGIDAVYVPSGYYEH